MNIHQDDIRLCGFELGNSSYNYVELLDEEVNQEWNIIKQRKLFSHVFLVPDYSS